jgi:hypothetical protein
VLTSSLLEEPVNAGKDWLRGAFGRDERRYLPLAEAAAAMQLDPDVVVKLVRRGALRARVRQEFLEVEPAVLSGPGVAELLDTGSIT